MREANKLPKTSVILTFKPKPKLKLSEIERIIKQQRIIVPCPSRQTLIGMCEDGTFQSVGKDKNGSPEPTRFGWLVFEESFWKWAQDLDNPAIAA